MQFYFCCFFFATALLFVFLRDLLFWLWYIIYFKAAFLNSFFVYCSYVFPVFCSAFFCSAFFSCVCFGIFLICSFFYYAFFSIFFICLFLVLLLVMLFCVLRWQSLFISIIIIMTFGGRNIFGINNFYIACFSAACRYIKIRVAGGLC